MQNLLFTISLLLILSVPRIGFAAESEEAPEVEESSTTSAYISLGDAMVLNLSSSRNRLTFLQLSADVLIKDADATDLITIHIPAIRHQLIVLLSGKQSRDMKSSVKREEIRKVATLKVQEVIESLSGNTDISDILFSRFLVQ